MKQMTTTYEHHGKSVVSPANGSQLSHPISPLKAPPSQEKKRSDSTICIHVIDTHTHKTEDFYCNKALILKHMKYFEEYTKKARANPYQTRRTGGKVESLEDLDITVQC